MDIIIASSHGYKIRETKAFLKRFPFFDIFSLVDFPHYHPPQESGETTEKKCPSKSCACRATAQCLGNCR